jgi:hypothetical protein
MELGAKLKLAGARRTAVLELWLLREPGFPCGLSRPSSVPTRSAEAQLFKTFSMRSLGSSRVVEAARSYFAVPCVPISVEAWQHPHGR